MTDLAAVPTAPAAPPRTPVMADVARLAGVSHQTVSRVVNGQDNLRPETRRRVEEAISQLGYRPNTAARALVTRRSATIGVIGSKSGFWGPSTVHRTVQAAAKEAGYFVSSANLQDLGRQELLDAINHLRDHSVEGIVLIAAHDEAVEVARAQTRMGLPVVVVEGDGSQARWTVGVDQVEGSRLATQHLLDLGHTAIAHLAGPQSWTEARGRLRGYRTAMRDAGHRAEDDPLVGDWSAASGYRAGLEIARRREVSAVCCANDQMALGLLRALSEAGRSVPGDVSVVGFDDIPEAAYMIPPLTTVHQDFTTVGRRAIEILQHVIAAGAQTDTQTDTQTSSPTSTLPPRLIGPELVVRASTEEHQR